MRAKCAECYKALYNQTINNTMSQGNIMNMFKTKKQAVEAATALRASGKTVKIFRHSGVGTVPGRGITPFLYYTLSVA